MGSFLGHFAPGSFFIFFGAWHLVHLFQNYFSYELPNSRSSKSGIRVHERSKRFSNRAFYLTAGRPLPAAAACLLSLTGMAMEIITGYKPKGMVGLHNLHHVSMYAFFCAAGAASLITRHCRGEEDGGGRFSSLRYADSLLMALALAVEGLLFAWHLHGRSPLDVQVHTFLLYAVLAGAVCMALEVAFPYEVILGVIRCCCFILQGTWFVQVGSILYPPFGGDAGWQVQDSHEQRMVLILLFVLHIGAAALSPVATGALVYFCCSLKTHNHSSREKGEYNKLACCDDEACGNSDNEEEDFILGKTA